MVRPTSRRFSYFGLSLALALHLSASGRAQDTPYFDELVDPAGRIRPHYEEAHKVYKKMRMKEKKSFLQKTKKDFRGDNMLDPMPRLLTQSEYDTLRRGVEQRGTAIRLFLQDYYSGKKTYQTVLPESVLDRIVSRGAETGYAGAVRPDTISFPVEWDGGAGYAVRMSVHSRKREVPFSPVQIPPSPHQTVHEVLPHTAYR